MILDRYISNMCHNHLNDTFSDYKWKQFSNWNDIPRDISFPKVTPAVLITEWGQHLKRWQTGKWSTNSKVQCSMPNAARYWGGI
jgi:hypothetical protein